MVFGNSPACENDVESLHIGQEVVQFVWPINISWSYTICSKKRSTHDLAYTMNKRLSFSICFC